jgi:hypothetical protein
MWSVTPVVGAILAVGGVLLIISDLSRCFRRDLVERLLPFHSPLSQTRPKWWRRRHARDQD